MVIAIALSAFVVAGSATRTIAHPMHTTLTEMAIDAEHHTVRAVVRVFDDDLARAVGHASRASDTQAETYVMSALRLTQNGATIALRPCGVRASGDLRWVCVEANDITDARALELRNALLCESYADQINIVQVVVAGAKRSVLFTRGDRAKRLL